MCLYDHITKHNIFPTWGTADTLAWIERLLTSLGTCSSCKKSQKKNSSCLQPPFPWPGKGGRVVLTIAKLYLQCEYTLYVYPTAHLLFWAEKAVVGTACVQDCLLLQWKYFRNLTITTQPKPTSTCRIPVGIGLLTNTWFRKIIGVPLWLHYKTQYILHMR